MTAPDPSLARLMLEQAPTALLHTDAAGTVLWANAAAQRLCPALQTQAAPALQTQAAPALQAQAAPALSALFASAPGLPPLPSDTAAWAQQRWPLELPLRQPAAVAPKATWLRLRAQALPDTTWLLELQPFDDEHALRQHLAALSSRNEGEVEGLGAQMALSIDLGQIAFWRHDLATNRMHYNAQAFEVLGIAPRAGGLSIDEVRQTIHPDDLPQVLASAQQALASGLPVDMDARYRRSDGSWRTVMTRRVLQRDAQGQPVAFVGLALDVTDRVDAQRHSNELAQRFALVTRIAGIGYWSKTLSEERATWSPELRHLFGLRDGQPVPQLRDWLAQHVHPDDRERVTTGFRQWIKSGAEQVSNEFRVLRADGQLRQVLTQSRLESPGANPLLFGVVIDVTESRSAAQALRDATERVALAARGAGLATWELDVDTGAAYWDAQMWRLRGLPPGTTTPDLAGRLATTHPDDRELVAQVNQRGLDEEGQIETAFRVVWPDGEVRWLSSRSALVRDESSGRLRRIGVNWDITDRRTAEVVRQERELAQRESRAKSQFLARMSHELRTPLNAVLGFTQLLQDDQRHRSDVQAQHRQWLGHIQAAGQHLLALINDVLELSSAESGSARLALQAVPLDQTVDEVLALLQPLQHRLGIRIQTEVPRLAVLADPTRLRQVLLNLLSNALKYNRPNGQVWLRVQTLAAAERTPGPPAGTPLQGQDSVLLSVTDTGRGLSPQQLAHLFEPFNRLGAEALGVEGTGIGLAIVKSLVERMGGQVSAHSQPDQGSCFQVRLQLAQAGTSAETQADGTAGSPTSAPTPAPTPTPNPSPQSAEPDAADLTGSSTAAAPLPLPLARAAASHRHQLLYIEDNPVNALIISELVARRPDLQLHVAADGLSGLSMALQLQPALVLLDMQLPDIDGYEVLRRLRSQPATAAIPCVALSANAMPEDIALALQAGVSDYWTKPLDFSVFMQALDRLFGPPA